MSEKEATATYHGGPAFPTEYFYDQESEYELMPSEGMTLRDYFAAKAMQGLLNHTIDWIPTNSIPSPESLDVLAEVARDSYFMADAMLKARWPK